MNTHLMKFLIYYLLYRMHGSLKKELGVITSFQAVKKWYELKSEIFKANPLQFKNKVLFLHNKNTSYHKQPCET